MTNGALVTVLQVLALAVLTAVPGGALTAPDGWTPPRTADGHPDLQGVWANNSATPLERPTELADKATLTDEEVAVLAARAAELFAYNDERGGVDAAFGDGVFQAVIADPDEHTSTDGGTGNYNAFWVVERDFDNRTSLVVDPPSGRIPLTAETVTGRAAIDPERRLNPAGPEEAGLSVRCISYGAPYLFAGYNSYFLLATTATSRFSRPRATWRSCRR